MELILQKIFKKSSQEAVKEIIQCYEQEESAIINFLYFSNIVSHQLFSDKDKTEKQREYKKILLKSDFLMPDGIALQTFYTLSVIFGKTKNAPLKLHNLNGTDFVPFFLENLKKKYGNQKLCILLYGTKAEYLPKVEEKIRLQGYNVIYTQDGYSDFDREKAEAALQEYQDTINILLVARSTTTIPLQELRVNRNFQKIQNNKLIVFTTGGLFDFIAGAQKRAPKIFRTLKLERLYRLLSDPKRNWKKVVNTLMIIPYIFKYLLFTKK